ncbi:hypothetical protein VTK73DRAFT_8315 [Phialemonium thermophilum]|uniref:Uncharacterized protein n=1 Tax=Phialemonium thermophilum TaxID=223376 RepID=A0ABR3Y683_9PEZI
MSESAVNAEVASSAGDTGPVSNSPVDAATEETNVVAKTEDGNNDASPGTLLKTTAQLNKKAPSSNRKFDPSTLPVTDDPDKIRAQVEFYFGDSNLPTDKHMWNLTGGPENKAVPLKEICAFKRMRRFQPYSAVVSALRDSKTLEISGPEGEEVVKRKKAYVPASDNAQARMAASVYVKGFGDEEPTTQFDIEAFFAPYGPVNAVRLRRTNENLFKGSVFVEFQTEELAKKFLALDPPPTWKGHELKIMSKKAYVEEKTKLIQEGKIEASNSKPKRFFEGKEIGGRGGHRSRGRDSKHSDTRDSGDWKKRKDDRFNRRGRGGHRRGRGGNRDRGGDRREAGGEGDGDSAKAAADSTATNEAAPEAANGKRVREDEGDGQPPAKKVDTKAEGEAPASA